MQIRPRYSNILKEDYLLPKVTSLTDQSIQDIIKSKIPKETFMDFLNKKINEDTIEDFRKLLELEDNPIYEGINDNKKKYLYDLIMVLLYEELFTCNEIIGLFENATAEYLINIFEKIVVLEYELFYLPVSVSSNIGAGNSTKIFFKQYIIDNVLNIYYGTSEKVSYEDYDNFKEELEKILEDTGTLPTELENILEFDTLVRKNGELAKAEKENHSKLLFILNYNSTSYNSTSTVYDRSYIRKTLALDNGYYIKNGIKYYFTDIKTYSYYQYFNIAFVQDYQDAHNFLIEFHDNLVKRTINY